MSVVDNLLSAGKDNKKTLESMDQTLKSILATDKKQAQADKAAARKAEQGAKRAAADRKKETKSDNKGIEKQLADIKKLLAEQKKSDKKDGGGGGGGALMSAAVPVASSLVKAAGPGIASGLKTVVAPIVTAVGAMAGLGRGITEIKNFVGDKRGTATIGEGDNQTKINRNELGDKLSMMRAVRTTGNYGGEDLTEKQSEVLDKNITLLEKLSNRMGMTESLDQQLAAKKDALENTQEGTKEFEKLTREIKDLNINLAQSKVKQKNLVNESNLDPALARRDALKPLTPFVNNPLLSWAVSKEDKDAIEKLKADGNWHASMDDIVQGRQTGGPITVPGSGSGDKVPMMLKPGSFVLNRNASKFLKRQTGGVVPTMLEPGELVFLNENIQRFQTGGEVSHPDTGTGFQPGNATDQSGRPVVLSEGAAEAFKKMMDAGGVKGTDVASSRRSVKKNAAVGGVPGSAHLGGNAIDIHGASKAWMIENSDKYGWKRNNYMNDSWHWDFTGKNSGNTGTNEGNDSKTENKKTEKKAFSLAGILSGAVGALASIFSPAMASLISSSGIMSGGLDMSQITSGALAGADLGALGGILSGISALGGGGDDTPYQGPPSTPGGAFGESSLVTAMDKAGMQNKKERAQFLAQMSHESGNFNFDEEIHDGSNYEGRSDLGNNQPGDGRRFKGRGYIQLTGRANYKKFGDIVGHDLIENPDLAKDPNIAADIAMAYWKDRGISRYAQAGDTTKVTQLINGGTNGLEDRKSKYETYITKGLQTGGMVSTMLEPGEAVFGPGQWDSSISNLNSAVPRFQSGGQVSGMNDSYINGLLRDADERMMKMESQQQTPQVVPVPMGGQSSGGGSSSTDNAPPFMPTGPSVNFLSDVINRTNMGSVFS